jgi:isopenicillin N synthase-like dioxygenase
MIQVEKVFAESDKFFAQSPIEKRKFLRQDDNSGYVAEGMESFDRSVKREVREAYNVNSPENVIFSNNFHS